MRITIRKFVEHAALCSTTLLLFLAFLGTTNAQSQKDGPQFRLENIQQVTNGEELSMPIWSPDGNQLLAATVHGMKLRMINLQGNNNILPISDSRGAGFDASWSADGKTVFYRYKENEHQIHPEIKSYSLENKKSAKTMLHPNGLLSASKASKNSDPVIFINVETLGIEAQTKDESSCWNITHDDGQYYRPLLSPDKKTVIVHEKSEMYLYAADGSGMIRHLGTGLASSWSPDGKFVLAFLDTSHDGHTISGSDLYIIDVEAGKLEKFTNTDDLNEMWPNWSSDGSKIAFEDERSGNIFIADIVRK